MPRSRPVSPHDSGEKFPTLAAVRKEAARLKASYRRRIRHSGMPGPEPNSDMFLLEAVRRLSALKDPKSDGRKERKKLFPDFGDEDLRNLYRTSAHKEIRRSSNWDDRRLGQKAFRLIKGSKDGVSARKIQRLLSISSDTLDNLPMPSPYIRRRQGKLVFDPPRPG